VTTTDFTLYCFAQSGNVFKAALMLISSPRDAQARVPGDQRNGRSAGARARRPALVLDYLVCVFRSFGWNNDDERREVLRWIPCGTTTS
jgi:glutathione S-transferase